MKKNWEKITYGFYSAPIGEMVLAETDKGLCWLGFMVEGYKGNGYQRMRAHFPDAEFVQDSVKIRRTGDDLVRAWERGDVSRITLDLRGSTFQMKVWEALMAIKKGDVKSYGDIANDIGKPKASRAVGSAVGENPVSLIVPCHRVLQKSGDIGNFGWGVDLKRELLKAEGVNV